MTQAPRPRHQVRVADQAKILGAFVRAFGDVLRGGKVPRETVQGALHRIPPGHSRLWARNARLLMEDDIAILLDDVEATLAVRDPLAPLIPEQTEGYRFLIHHGRMAMDAPSISTTMQRHAYPPHAAPLEDLRVSLPDGLVQLEATFRAGGFLRIPLLMRLTPKATPDGQIALLPREVRAQGLPIDRLMSLLGVELGRFVPEGGKLRFEGGAFLLNPVGMMPSPETTGHLVETMVQGEHLVMCYDDGSARRAPTLAAPEADSYIAMMGHDLLVGKITMADVCLQMVPLDPQAHWVEFALPHYRAQLAAGESSLRFGDELLYRIPAVEVLPG
ncbi:MAG: hypothetical protein VKP62_00565, partial [Candidatus Sericytochromatia bacterium]|nr:hypothetical protein [Candidatus Sericytochromatia bacterium]